MDQDNKLMLEALASKFTKPVNMSDSIKTQLGQAHGIIKGLIETLDKTPTEQTPYNEMAITHLVNLEEDLKELSGMLKDRMLKKSENAETFTHNHQLDHEKVLGHDNKHNIKYTYELAVANLPRDIDVSDRPGQERVINLAYHELVKAFEGKYKNPRLAAANAFDEDLPMEIISQYKHYQQHGFPGENREENAKSAEEKRERVQRGWDINKKRWAKWKMENPEAAAKHAAKKAKSGN